MASRNIEDLSSAMQRLYAQFKAEVDAAGISYLVTCTYRSNKEQQELFDSGRNYPGPVRTNAGPGQSAHNTVDYAGRPAAEAFDVVPLVNGKPCWENGHPAWAQLGAIGEHVGLQWAGHWRTFKEFPHFQNPSWRP